MRIVDGYVHVGIDKYRPVEVLTSLMNDVGVDRAVLCQYLGMTDNTYLEKCVNDSDGRLAACAMVDLANGGWRTSIERVARSGAFRGIRMTTESVHHTPEAADLALRLGLTLVLYRNAPAAPSAEAVRRIHSDGVIVVSHLGIAPITEQTPLSDEQMLVSDVVDLSGDPRVQLGVSGASLFESFPYPRYARLLDAVRDRFGTRRLLWGSNFPASSSTLTEYRRDLDLAKNGWGFTDAEFADVACENALRTWFAAEPGT